MPPLQCRSWPVRRRAGINKIKTIKIIDKDIIGTEKEISFNYRGVLNDIKEGKQTIIYKYAIDNANDNELETIKKYYGKPNLTIEENNIITNLFEKLGAKTNAEKLVEDYTNKAIEIINNSNLKNKDLFIGFANYLVNRKN